MSSAKWKQPFHTARRILAGQWIKLNPQVKIIGVTGSYGKTNTSLAITTVLSQKAPTLQTDLNLDTVYNIPITVLKLRPKHKFLVLEMGVDHPGEMDSYLKMAKPFIGVITGITPVHSDEEHLGSLEGIVNEKGKLLESLPENGWAILNHDNFDVCRMATKTKAKVVWYGIEGKNDFWADKIKVDFTGTTFNLHAPELTLESPKVKMGLIGKHFVHAALAAAAVGWVNGLTVEQIISGIEELEPLDGRLSVEEGPAGTVLLNDAKRANPISTIAGLETLTELPTEGRRIAVLGEMGELGDAAEDQHKLLGQKSASLNLDYLITVGPLQKLTAEEAVKKGMDEKKVIWVNDVAQAAGVLKKIIKKGDLLYLKGSLLRHMERIIYLLDGKQVDCRLTSCHYYHPCSQCRLLNSS